MAKTKYLKLKKRRTKKINGGAEDSYSYTQMVKNVFGSMRNTISPPMKTWHWSIGMNQKKYSNSIL